MGGLTEPEPESERTDGSILLYVCIWRPTSLRAARIRTKLQGPEVRRQSKKLRTQGKQDFLEMVRTHLAVRHAFLFIY
jgi:hypothetical protein